MAHIRAGRYEEAEGILRALSRDLDSPNQVKRTTARVLLEMGRHEEAQEVVEGQDGEAASPRFGERIRGKPLCRRSGSGGRGAFRRAVDGRAGDRHVARVNLGVLLWNRGEREEALAIFDSFIDLYNGSLAVSLRRISWPWRWPSGIWGSRTLCFTRTPSWPSTKRPRQTPTILVQILLTGELFLEKYKATDARESFRQALERNPRHPRALLGQARILDFEGAGGAWSW